MLLKFYKNRFKCCQITLMIFFATTVWGQEQTAGHGNNSHFSIGMAFVSSDPVYINTNRSARLIPFLSLINYNTIRLKIKCIFKCKFNRSIFSD